MAVGSTAEDACRVIGATSGAGLASTAPGEGASLIGVNATGHTVEVDIAATVAVRPNNLYVDAGATVGGDGSFVYPFATISAALAAISGSNTVVNIAPGTYTENLVIPDIDGIVIQGAHEHVTVVQNNGAAHTLYWVPAAGPGALIQKFALRDLEIINTAVGFDAIHIDGNAVNGALVGFLCDEFDMDYIDVDKSGAGYAVYLRNVGVCYPTHGQWGGADSTILNVGQFRCGQLEIGTQTAPQNFHVEYNGANPRNIIGRADNTISQGTVIWGDVVLKGHPIFQGDSGSLIWGDVTEDGLTSFYVSGRDYCPIVVCSSTVGFATSAGGQITLTLPDPVPHATEPLANAISIISFSGATVWGTVTIAKPTNGPVAEPTRQYGVFVAHNATFEVGAAPYVGTVNANGYVAMNLKGSVYNQSALATTGTGTIDRTLHLIKALSTPGPTPTVVAITPPFPDASYTVSATPSTNTTVWVPAGRTLAGFALSQATYGGTCDLVISR